MHTKTCSEEGWETWKENFLNHISDWSFLSADEELEKIKNLLLTQQQIALLEEIKQTVNEVFPKWLDDIEETTQEIPSDPVLAADQAAKHFRDKILQSLNSLDKK